MLAAIGLRFAIEGDLVEAERYTGGHINDTYFVTYRTASGRRRYVHQRINTAVFADPHAVCRNIAGVTTHIAGKLRAAGVPDIHRRVLHVVPTREGEQMLVTPEGEYWRTYRYVEDTTSRMQVQTAVDAFEAARGFGEFAAQVADFPAASLHETIAGFHDTPARFAALASSISADIVNRASSAKNAIETALSFEPLARALEELACAYQLPFRTTHNDTKITNVLFDSRTQHALCIVDLDTVMPGLLLFDVGELIRTCATTAAEDEREPGKASIDPDLFEAVAAGFLCGSGSLCSQAEQTAFVTAGKVMAFENGIRFLTDYLQGDRYFRVHHSRQNLDRAYAQLQLVQSLEVQEEELQRRVERASQAA